MTLKEMCAKFNDGVNPQKFQNIKNKFSERPDLHAFVLLDKIVPLSEKSCNKGMYKMVGSAGHDQIWLGIDIEELAKIITEEQVEELSCCGIFISDDALSMFI